VQLPEPEQLKAIYREHINAGFYATLAFMGTDTAEVEAQGWIVRTADGREFIDCLGGFGTFNFGHRHPRIVAAVKDQLDLMPMSSRMALNPVQAQLAAKLAEITPAGLAYSFFSNSGTEAVEAAIKLARLSTHKPGIVSAKNAFHGKTLGSLSSTHRESFQQPFRPLMQHFTEAPFGAIDALASAIDEQTAAVMLEPVQGEGGINVAPAGYLTAVRELTKARGVLFILDEVQTGMGRTGRNFACEYESVCPDILVLAKSLGGGVMPLGATIGTAEVWRPFNESPTVHSSTFGGNQLACAAGLAAIEVLLNENLAQQAAENGAILLAGLQLLAREFPQIIKQVRGLGLMIGIELHATDLSQLMIANMLEHGVLVAYTLNHTGVVRLEPPLIMPRAVCEDVLARIHAALAGTLQVMEQFGLLTN
jgi:putrescine aminotransferase